MTDANPEPQPAQPSFNIMMPPQMLGGVWANYAQINQSDYEFTVDFIRLDYSASVGVAVARVSMSPLMVMQLNDALQASWARYAESAMPQEVHGDDPDATQGNGPVPAE